MEPLRHPFRFGAIHSSIEEWVFSHGGSPEDTDEAVDDDGRRSSGYDDVVRVVGHFRCVFNEGDQAVFEHRRAPPHDEPCSGEAPGQLAGGLFNHPDGLLELGQKD